MLLPYCSYTLDSILATEIVSQKVALKYQGKNCFRTLSKIDPDWLVLLPDFALRDRFTCSLRESFVAKKERGDAVGLGTLFE
jgi:hypothetical protein